MQCLYFKSLLTDTCSFTDNENVRGGNSELSVVEVVKEERGCGDCGSTEGKPECHVRYK